MAKKNKQKKSSQKKTKLKINVKALFLLLLLIIFSILYLHSTILFVLGMLPTLVAFFVDKQVGKNKTFTIGSLNFAACFYYLTKVWSHAQPMEMAIDFITNPKTYVVIYSAAALGYLINYITTIIVASVLKQKSLIRLEKLEKAKKQLEERWGEKVNGDKPLNSKGFPMEYHDDEIEEV